MKALSIVIKALIITLAIMLLIVCASDLIDYLQHPVDYFLGSEVVDKSGWSYSSRFAFIFSNFIYVVLSILISIMTLKINNIKYLIFLLLFIIFQILCFILL
jgi:hypothetical protein